MPDVPLLENKSKHIHRARENPACSDFGKLLHSFAIVGEAGPGRVA